ncbi:exonuclease 3'-5' domain-containing protein 2 [Salarias fasciatus]|uniref:Exonuclease 3'-5' domain-containing protein 2 n=1 Tax=Salarias fasciatus TaxID=181472 RepID=A0A672FQF4_SALFA|nr:exonuclease 3'-5' domain-containing protein 2 [Salarias fasciatus]
MSHRGPAAVLTAVLGAALGGLLLWRAYRTRKRPPFDQEAAEPAEAPPTADSRCRRASRRPPPLHFLSSDQLLGVKPVVVSCEDDWQRLWPLVQEDLSVFPVLGLDCEWVSVKGRPSTVSLLQMSSYSGLCVLVRLLAFWSGRHAFPASLTDVLRDPRVFKVGVGCYEDGKRLTRDYGLSLSCTVDLRYLALRQRRASLDNGLSLKSLAADLLDVSLDKSLELRCSDWEADQLTAEQMSYAARDAQVSMALFLHLLGLKPDTGLAPSDGSSYSELASRCQGLVDVPFRGRGDGDGREKRRPPPACTVPASGDEQTPDPRRNKRKPLGVGYSARKSPLYDNCFLHAPDGQPLCTCDKKKAKWYLDKGIGVLRSEEPFVVQLLFEPSGRPDSQQDYYLTAKENLCVVCGKVDSYIRKNIVPHEYRRHFPTEMKDHNSHDILLLCTACHAASNVHDGVLKQRLAEEFAAPQGCEEGVRLLEDPERRRVRSAARALLTAGEGLPERRRDELTALIRDFLDVSPDRQLDAQALQQAADLETRIWNEAYVPHGLKVVRAQAARGLRGLMELERRWRQHFLDSMRPQHLPPRWAVDHNHAKLLRKHGEDLPVQLH